MKFVTSIAVSVLAALTVIGCASDTGHMANPDPVTSRQTKMGLVLTDRTGMTLYTLESDPADGTNCYGPCARTWPPLRAPEAAVAYGEMTVINRNDGAPQWGYRSKALYTWHRDKNPGDVTGHNIGNVWHAARP